jgi:uncharacterized membrane protein
MRRRVIALAVAASLAGAIPVAFAETSAGSGPQAQAACRSATIGGRHKCIARGQFCAHRYQRDYRRYGYSCSKLDRNGRYHLT